MGLIPLNASLAPIEIITASYSSSNTHLNLLNKPVEVSPETPEFISFRLILE